MKNQNEEAIRDVFRFVGGLIFGGIAVFLMGEDPLWVGILLPFVALLCASIESIFHKKRVANPGRQPFFWDL